MRPASRLEVGSLFQQRYRIEKLIGVGGMGYVYLASDLRLMGKTWAIKESIPIHYNQAHLLQEAKWLTELKHPNLPLIVDFYPPHEDDRAYLVMEYIDGETLAERISRQSITFREAVDLCIQLCDALSYLHGHSPPIIYRDMKPSNVMLTRLGQVKLIDFGIARAHKDEINSDTIKLGTLGFAAPEQYEDVQSDARTDLYGVGALMAFVLSDGHWQGHNSFRASMLRSDVPESMVSIILKLLSKRPADRYQDAHSLRTDLHGCLLTASAGNASQQDLVQPYSTGALNKGIVIACMSAAAGLGCTHASILIANVLNRTAHGRIAFIDYSSTELSVVEQLSTFIDGEERFYQEEQKLRYQGVDYFHTSHLKRKHDGNFLPFLLHEYDYIVLDIGFSQSSDHVDEFMRAAFSLLIHSISAWKHQQCMQAVHLLEERRFNQWICAVPHAGDKELRSSAARSYGRHLISVPTVSNPFMIDERIEKWLEQWFQSAAKKKRRFYFHKWLSS